MDSRWIGPVTGVEIKMCCGRLFHVLINVWLKPLLVGRFGSNISINPQFYIKSVPT